MPIFGYRVVVSHPRSGVQATASTPRRARLAAAARRAKVGGDLGLAASPGAAPAVAAAHQVPDLAFHLGSGAPVVRDPARITLPVTGRGELPLVVADHDAASAARCGALLTQGAAGAHVTEAGDACPVLAARDRRAVPGRAGDAVLVEVDVELVLAEPAPELAGCWVLHLDSIPSCSKRSWNGPVP